MSTKPVITMEIAQAIAAAKRARVRKARESDPWAQQARHTGWIEAPDGSPVWKSQLAPPGDWSLWLLMAGRGFGKTRVGAEWVRQQAMAGSDGMIISLVGPTAADVRDVMIEGESGILACCERYKFKAKYQPSRRRIVFGHGVIARTYSADEPERLRGAQCHRAWSDEVGAWRYLDAWDQLQYTNRLPMPDGTSVKQVVTTTPRPTKIVRKILARKGLVITRGSSYENRKNLADEWFEEVIKPYEGTRLGRQEIDGELLDALEGALWNHDQIDALRVPFDEKREFRRIVVAIDPPAGDDSRAAECGIVVAGIGHDGHCYVIADRSLRGSPAEWAAAAWAAADEFDADALVYEINMGGAMVRHTLQTARPKSGRPRRMLAVRATKGKILRAEPASALYEQGRVHHVGTFGPLEDQMCNYLPEEAAKRRKDETGEGQSSPDRLDAAVYAISELMIGKKTGYTTTAG